MISGRDETSLAETAGEIGEDTGAEVDHHAVNLTRADVIRVLVEHLALSQPNVSKHLRVLREVGLVEVRHDARRRFYGLRAEPLIEVDEWLEPYRRFWAGRLDALERHLDEQAKGDKT